MTVLNHVFGMKADLVLKATNLCVFLVVVAAAIRIHLCYIFLG